MLLGLATMSVAALTLHVEPVWAELWVAPPTPAASRPDASQLPIAT
jgi:hypothetical protein